MATWRFLTRTRACVTVTCPPDINPGIPATASPDESYDYIIIGVGCAGGVLANRLAADPACDVLLQARADFETFWILAGAGLILEGDRKSVV